MFQSVIIATKGRAHVLKETVASVLQQGMPADEIIISATDPSDVEGLSEGASLRILFGQPGLNSQLNTGIQNLDPRCELVTILDDDVELARDYFSSLRAYMEQHPEVLGAGGSVILDGATREESLQALGRIVPQSQEPAQNASSFYGCNMSYRRSAMGDELFDERMKLNSWMGDFEFSSRIGRTGLLKMLPNLRLCHLKTQSGRMNHRRFGFVQIMHPWYFHHKGVIGVGELWKDHVLKVLFANLLKLPIKPGERLDRLKGNLFALKLITQGVVEPEAVTRIA